MPNMQATDKPEYPMKNDNTETTQLTNLNETELENVKGGAPV